MYFYLSHRLLVDVLPALIRPGLEGVAPQGLQHLVGPDRPVLGLQQGWVHLLRLQNADHLLSRLGDRGRG